MEDRSSMKNPDHHVTSVEAQASQLRTKLVHHKELWGVFDRSGNRQARSSQAAIILGLEKELDSILLLSKA